MPKKDPDQLIAEGVAAESAGLPLEALAHFRAAVEAAPAYSAAHLNLGIGLEASGDPEGAMRSYQSAIELDPRDPFARYNLGRLRFTRGDMSGALEMLEAALQRKPEWPDARVVLASVHESLGNFEAALVALREALALRPDYAGALRNLGLLLARLGRWAEAEDALRRATAQARDDADAQHWRGRALVHLQRPQEAAECFHEALRVRPDFAEPHCYLGNILGDQGRSEEAIAHLSRAIALKPDLADAHLGLGNMHLAGRRLEDGAACYRRALALDAHLVQAHVNLGNALCDLGRPDEARRAFEAALHVDPESAEARWSRAMARIPALRESPEELPRSRAAFEEDLAALERWFDGARAEQGHRVVGVQQPFWLAYQEENNAALLRRYGQLCARLMAPWQRARGLLPPGDRPGRRIRVGIVSQYIRHHSVWNAIAKGWFQHLDPERFELAAFCLSAQQDAETRYARSRAARFEQGARPLEQWAEAIRAARPDALVFPEIGMDPMSVKLASLRLAPLQAVSWGHPETTGLPTIDCFLSAADMEPEGAQAAYTEELVALPHLGCCVQPAAEALPPPLYDLGVDLPSPLFVCPGTPFKYAPEHDRVFTRIAHELGACRFVFFTHWTQALSEKLRQRLARAFERAGLEFGRYVVFLPWLTRPAFLGLMRRADVFLDTIGFSGFNTALQAVECSLPAVTWQGRFLRGRLAAGILQRIGLEELVARNEGEYVALALRLARERDYREDVRRRMRARAAAPFGDTAPIRALEDFLQSRLR